MKNNEHASLDPLALFNDNLKSWHVVLLYEEPELARVIEFRFIRDGLEKGQSCCYIIHGGNRELIESEMADNGIDVVRYTKNNMLQIIESIDHLNDPRGLFVACEGETRKLCANLSAPFRIVGGLSVRDTLNMINNPEIETIAAKAHLELEHSFHNQLFDGLQGYWLCSYTVNDIKGALNGGNYDKNRLMLNLLKSHNGAVFATKMGKGLSVFMP